LFPLKDGWNTVGSAANSDINAGAHARQRRSFSARRQADPLRAGERCHRDCQGFKVGATALIRNDGDKDGVDEISFGDFVLWVHMSGGRPTIRLRDPKGEAARSFRGFRWFAIDESYRVTARFIKDPEPREIRAPNQLGDEEVTTEGVASSRSTVRPCACARPQLTEAFVVYLPGRHGRPETCETARFLCQPVTMHDRAGFQPGVNPPCAFNPYTTCPILFRRTE
jgi:uncharacterized protein (DUF1684 family)